MTVPRRLAAWLAIVVALAAAAACGIPSDDEPRAIPADRVDDQVAAPRSTDPTTTLATGATTQQTIYLVVGNASTTQLFGVPVAVEQPPDPSQQPRFVLDKLITTRPADVGLAEVATNAIPSGIEIRSTSVGPDGVLNLDLESFGIEGDNLRDAIAQVVFTMTELSGISGVRLSFDGTQIAVPTELGNLEPGAVVTRSNYPSLVPSPQPAE